MSEQSDAQPDARRWSHGLACQAAETGEWEDCTCRGGSVDFPDEVLAWYAHTKEEQMAVDPHGYITVKFEVTHEAGEALLAGTARPKESYEPFGIAVSSLRQALHLALARYEPTDRAGHPQPHLEEESGLE